MLFLLPFLTVAGSLLSLYVLAYVYAQRKRDGVNRSYLGIVVICFFWNVMSMLHCFPLGLKVSFVIYRLMVPLPVMMLFFFLNFVYRLTGRTNNFIYYASMVMCIMASIVGVATDTVVDGIVLKNNYPIHFAGPGFQFFFPLIGICAYGFVILLEGLKTTENPLERKAYWTFLISCFTMVLLALFTFIFTTVTDKVYLQALIPFGVALLLYLSFSAIIRFNILTVSVEEAAIELFRDAREGIILTSLAGYVLRMNRAAEVMFGVGRDCALGQHISGLLDHESLEETFQKKYFCFNRDGEERQYLVSRSYVQPQSIPLGTVISLYDGTEQIRVHRMLKETTEDLERKVEERTLELRKTRKMEDIGVLAGRIAHDINNLLAAIFGFTEAAMDEAPLDSNARTDLKEVNFAARRARDIIRKILDFCRKQEQVEDSVSMGQIVSDGMSLLESSLPPNVSVRIDINNPQDDLLRGDPTELRQIVMNLFTNAMQAMGEDGGEIHVSVGKVDVDENFARDHKPLVPGVHMMLVVSDTGCGIDLDVLPKIFEPFFSAREDGSGTGLGLSTVLRNVKSHDGSLSVTSEKGMGTTVEVYLPVASESQIPVLDGTMSDQSFPEGRILFVDDEQQLSRAVKRMLEPYGYHVTSMTSSYKALELFTKNPNDYDLLITDQTMPQMTGTQLAEEILHVRPSLPIILLSGYTDSLVPRQAADIGIRAFLSKPVTKDDLASTVKRILDQELL